MNQPQVLIVGATSAIAGEVARIYAARNAEFFLIARNARNLKSVAGDLRIRGAARVETLVVDLESPDRIRPAVESVFESYPGLDIALFAQGYLPDQLAAERNLGLVRRTIEVNATSVILMSTLIAHQFENRRRGMLAVISSVAGDRGRQKNYVYGAAKAAVDVHFSGLRNRLHVSRIPVITIKPGMVDTPMTAHLPKNALFASPRKVARDIVRALDKRRHIVYTPRYWRPIMAAVRLIPEWMFKRTNI